MIALVRPVSATFDRALTREPGRRPDVARARAQHRAYTDALERLGCTLVQVPAADALPDACFIEDTLVVARGRALLTRPGAPSRRPELTAVRDALAGLPVSLHVEETPDEATLDGGDVLRVGDHLFVGRSARTDAGGVEALRRAFGPVGLHVVEVPVRDALHLKCHASTPAPGVVLLAEGFAAPERFEPYRVVVVPASEAYAANVVGVGSSVLVAEGHPITISRLKALDLDPIPLPVDEIAAADGSLTCLSVVVDHEGFRDVHATH